MSPEVLSPSVVGACETELARLIEEMENAPSRTALFDIGAAAEIVVLAPAGSHVEPLRNRLANAALRWMRSGLLEDLVVARVEFGYHVAMLAYLASEDPDRVSRARTPMVVTCASCATRHRPA